MSGSDPLELLRAFADVPDLHIVQLDAHLDFTDVRNDTRWSNSSPFRRACEALPNLTHITTVGLRGLRFDPEAVAAASTSQNSLSAPGRASAVAPSSSSRSNTPTPFALTTMSAAGASASTARSPSSVAG